MPRMNARMFYLGALETNSTEFPDGAVRQLSHDAFYVRGSIPLSGHILKKILLCVSWFSV